MNDPNERGDGKTGVVIAVVLFVLLVPCVVGVLAVGGAVFLFRASAVPQPPAIEVQDHMPEIAPVPEVAPVPPEIAQPESPP